MEKDKKVILINGNNNEWYEQAIFIVKNEEEDEGQINFVGEAEQIINRYMMGSDIEYIDKDLLKDKKEHINTISSDFETTVNYIMIMCCIILLFGILIIIK